jgi:L-arabinokinase
LARLGQQAENHIVGAPCGLMDQLTCAYGTPGLLLPIICRPDELLESVPLPQDMAVVGWPSGIKHAVSDSPYGTARTAAFMGLKIASRVLNRNWNYASEIAPSLFHKKLAKALPETMSGKNFSEEFEGVEDPLCEIVDGRIYPIKAAFSFPILENDRCLRTVDLLRELANKTDEEKLKEIGECLYASHNGYSAMGLGCPETDRMVEAVRKLGPSKGFFGARITGGGSGGTVVVFLKKTALPRLEKLAREIYFTRAKPLSLIY